MNDSVSTAHADETGVVRCTGANGVFRSLVIHGAVLELVTFGFYRFWLTTDIRRHLWSNTEIAGDTLEYTGRGKELLLGFLVALAVLLPVFLLYFLVGVAFERWKAFTSLPLYAFLFLFGQFAVYRARRYRLTRTIWRGLRFWMTGSGWAYAWRSFLWGLLLIPSLGFAYPWRTAALERYKLGHTFYGVLPGRFAATGGQLFKSVWLIWLLGLLPAAVVIAGSLIAISGAEMVKIHNIERGNMFLAAGVITLGIGCALCIALPFLHALRKATEWRWWAGGIRFGDATVTCGLPRSALIGVYWTLYGIGLLVLLWFGGAGFAIAIWLSQLGHSGSLAATLARMPIWAVLAYAVWYLAMILTFGVLARIYTMQRVWRRVINFCALVNAEAAADVTAAGEAASALGEGLADGLDFAGF
jgi:uncharacterized membrane protein YjgN (DUF898 family)